MTSNGKYIPITHTAGVQPSTEQTAFTTDHWTLADKIRFVNGKPEKIGGHSSIDFDDSLTLSGKPRSIFTTQFPTRVIAVVGTHQKLYNINGTILTNITPLQTATVAIANSLATDYGTLGADPITTVNGSTTITVADTNAPLYAVGDVVTFAGSAAVNGVPAGDINTALIIRSVGASSYTVRVSTAATSSGAGGGGAVVRATGRVRVTAAAHAQANGDRVKMAGAVAAGGVTAAQINLEFIIRNVAAGTFDIFTAGTATSSVAAAGGAGTTYQKEITDGKADESFGQGYGMGLYGAGLYGVSKVSSSGRIFPRTWFFDRFGDNIIANAGEQTGVYTWDASITAAPTLVANAPTAVNYAFVSDNILITFGAAGVQNEIFASDQGDITNWTASSLNQVFQDTIEGAGRLISHVPLNGSNLIFTENQTYTFRKIPRDSGVWEIKKISDQIGIIAPMARCVVNGIGYWMGLENWYMYRGGSVEIIPANTQPESTIRKYVFENINRSQKSKSFAWYNTDFNEIWFHYPTAGSNEPDAIARVSLGDFSWVMDTADRIAAEYPSINLHNPYLASSGGVIYKHELGTDADGAALAWSLTGPKQAIAENVTTITGIIPDSRQLGSITANWKTYQFPQSATANYNADYTITPTTEIVPTQVNGRVFQLSLSGSAISQYWQMGDWVFEGTKAGRA